MEYLRATGAWMNWINRQIDDVMVKAGISDWGGWRVSSMSWPRYFQVVGVSETGTVGFVGDSASGTCEVWCRRVGEEHPTLTDSVEEIAECLDMPLERAGIVTTGMTEAVKLGYAALSYYDGWTLVETSEGRLLPGLMTQRGTMVDVDRAVSAGRLGLGQAAYTIHREGDDVWAQPVDGGERVELERIGTRWGSYVVLPGAESVTFEVHEAAWAAWSAQEHALGRVGPYENADVYEWRPAGDFTISTTGSGSEGYIPVVRYQSGEWTTIVLVGDDEFVNLIKDGKAYAAGIPVPAARYLIEADLIRQASQPGMSTSTAPEGLSQELADLTEKIDSITDWVGIHVAYFDGTPYVWTEDESIIRLIEGAGGVVEAATPSGEVWREGLWAIHRSTEEDERVLNEVNRQRGAHPAAASSLLVETS